MIDAVTLGPSDAEIEYTPAGPIIHIFPADSEPKKVIQDLIEGLFLLHSSKANYDTLGEMMKNKNDETTKKMLDIMKRNLAHELIEAGKYSDKFVFKMKHK